MEVVESTLSKIKTTGSFVAKKIYNSNIIMKAILGGEAGKIGPSLGSQWEEINGFEFGWDCVKS